MRSPDFAEPVQAAVPVAETPEAEASEITLLRRKFGEKVHPLWTDKFLAASKEYYSRPGWLAREIAQNYVDHNPGENRGTLKGVTIRVEDAPESRKAKRITITGQWAFREKTGLLTMHSEKPEEGQSAGGNGIGLKQTSFILTRDFGIRRFDVDGEQWRVGYRMISKEESGVKNNYFVAEEKSGGLRGQNAYIIETDDPAVTEVLRELPNIAVGPENKFLRELDFENRHGAWKWLPPDKKGQPGVGRFFMNGQVMDVWDGPDSKGWQGMRGMTLQLNNVNYGKNMDRPPMSAWVMAMHADELVRNMKPEDLIDQISRSEKVWSVKNNEEWEALKIIEKLVERLASTLRFSKDSKVQETSEALKQYFAEKKYLARTESIGKKFEKQLEDEGYVLCPGFFEKIGMPSASERIDSAAMAAEQKPDPAMARYQRERMAEESGIEVAYQSMGRLDSKEFVKAVKERLSPFLASMEVKDDELRIEFSQAIGASIVTRVSLSGSSEDQRLLSAVRDIAAQGLESGAFKQIALLHAEGVVAFGIDGRGESAALFVKTIKGKPGIAAESRLEARLDPEVAPVFKSLEEPGKTTSQIRETKKLQKRKDQHEGLDSGLEDWNAGDAGILTRPINKKWVAAASLTAFLALGGWLGFGKEKSGEESSVKGVARAAAAEIKRAPSPESEEYARWKTDRGRHLIEAANYPQGASLESIVAAYNQASVPPGSPGAPSVYEAPQISDPIEGFEIVREPSAEQLERLTILRDAFYILTNHRVDNYLFIFRGQGAKGVNMGREGIGIHEEAVGGDFQEALNTFTHEVAHNNPYAGGHDAEFRATTAALAGRSIDKLMNALDKADKGERLTQEEKRLVDLRRDWGS